MSGYQSCSKGDSGPTLHTWRRLGRSWGPPGSLRRRVAGRILGQSALPTGGTFTLSNVYSNDDSSTSDMASAPRPRPVPIFRVTDSPTPPSSASQCFGCHHVAFAMDSTARSAIAMTLQSLIWRRRRGDPQRRGKRAHRHRSARRELTTNAVRAAGDARRNVSCTHFAPRAATRPANGSTQTDTMVRGVGRLIFAPSHRVPLSRVLVLMPAIVD